MLLDTKSSFAFLHCLKTSHKSICLLLHLCTICKMTVSHEDEKLLPCKYGRSNVLKLLQSLQSCKGTVEWYRIKDCDLDWTLVRQHCCCL